MDKQRHSTRIHESFWFLPSIVVSAMILLAYGVICLDRFLAPVVGKLGFILHQDAMRTFLATIAGSMMTVAGVVFSIMILVLSQAAGQYTSRVLRNFMRNRNNQFVLGLFVGIFLFCLFLLANLHPTNNLIAAISGFSLALLGVAFLISFIHAMSTSIQSSEIILNIKNETMKIINAVYPQTLQESPFVPVPKITGYRVLSNKTGYIQEIDQEDLLQIAIEKGRVLQLNKKIGEFVMDGELLCEIEGQEGLNEDLINRINDSFKAGAYRTAEHDITFGIQQLVDIALKGLSPGINDLMTAQLAIDNLSSLFFILANRKIIHEFICDTEECKRLLIESWCFASLIEMGFVPIIENAKTQPYLIRKIETNLLKIQNACIEERRKNTINRLLQMLKES